MDKKITPRIYSHRRKGLLSLEYGLLISVAVVALIGMSVYLGRSLSGRWRDLGDGFGFGRQYEPGLTREESSVVSENPVTQPNCHVELECEVRERGGPPQCRAVQVCDP